MTQAAEAHHADPHGAGLQQLGGEVPGRSVGGRRREVPGQPGASVGMINIGLGYGQLRPLLPAISDPLLLRAAGVL